MPTSFEAMHEETRPLALLDEKPPPPPRAGTIVGWCLTGLVVLLLLL